MQDRFSDFDVEPVNYPGLNIGEICIGNSPVYKIINQFTQKSICLGLKSIEELIRISKNVIFWADHMAKKEKDLQCQFIHLINHALKYGMQFANDVLVAEIENGELVLDVLANFDDYFKMCVDVANHLKTDHELQLVLFPSPTPPTPPVQQSMKKKGRGIKKRSKAQMADDNDDDNGNDDDEVVKPKRRAISTKILESSEDETGGEVTLGTTTQKPLAINVSSPNRTGVSTEKCNIQPEPSADIQHDPNPIDTIETVELLDDEASSGSEEADDSEHTDDDDEVDEEAHKKDGADKLVHIQ